MGIASSAGALFSEQNDTKIMQIGQIVQILFNFKDVEISKICETIALLL